MHLCIEVLTATRWPLEKDKAQSTWGNVAPKAPHIAPRVLWATTGDFLARGWAAMRPARVTLDGNDWLVLCQANRARTEYSWCAGCNSLCYAVLAAAYSLGIFFQHPCVDQALLNCLYGTREVTLGVCPVTGTCALPLLR